MLLTSERRDPRERCTDRVLAGCSWIPYQETKGQRGAGLFRTLRTGSDRWWRAERSVWWGSGLQWNVL